MKIKIHYRREPSATNLKGMLTSPLENLEIQFMGELRSTNPNQQLPIAIHTLKLIPSMEFYSFLDTIVDDGEYVLANLYLPNFLNEMDRRVTSINGLFLLSLGEGLINIFDNVCSARGRLGCPTRIITGNASFTFNGMNFYPMMMRDMSVAYYICDADSEEHDWRKKHGVDFDKMFSIGVEQPIVFDATLGIYQTRSAELLKD